MENKIIDKDHVINELIGNFWVSCDDTPEEFEQRPEIIAARAALQAPAPKECASAVAFCRVEDVFDNDSMLAQMGVRRGDKLYAVPQQPVATIEPTEWRSLALQFDEHRMRALWHLKAILSNPADRDALEMANKFLSLPPMNGEKVLSGRIAKLAQQYGANAKANCKTCSGNDANRHCLYPSKGAAGCLLDIRLSNTAQGRSSASTTVMQDEMSK
jgi:hypothetical protein